MLNPGKEAYAGLKWYENESDKDLKMRNNGKTTLPFPNQVGTILLLPEGQKIYKINLKTLVGLTSN